MQNCLRKTIIKLEEGMELLFWKLTKFLKFGCKALFYLPDTSATFDVTVLSKNLLQLNNFSETTLMNIKRYQHLNPKIVCPIFCITQDQECIYIVSEAPVYRLSDLLNKREGLTEFQIIYFLLGLIEILNYLKSRNSFYQFIDIDEIYLTSSMKISIPFSIWMSSLSCDKPIPLRHEDKKSYICPEIVKNGIIQPDQVNAWNVGLFGYELLEARKPYSGKDNTQIVFTKTIGPQLQNLLSMLLKRNPSHRLKFHLILVSPLFKKYAALPHVLPDTIFRCPPSSEYISQYSKKFEEKEKEEQTNYQNKVFNIKTVSQFDDLIEKTDKPPIRKFMSFKYIKPADWSLTEVLHYVSEFVDISDSFGYGYQMNSGIVSFIFNDGSQMQLQNSKKLITYTNEKKQATQFGINRVPEEGEVKKKFQILQAYAKSIKKFRHCPIEMFKPVIVTQYLKASCAAIFLLSNQMLQIIFADKMTILMSKQAMHIQTKNSQKFQNYEEIQESEDLLLRKKYALSIASRQFHWNIQNLSHHSNGFPQ